LKYKGNAMPFTFSECDIPGLVVIEPRVFPDSRGFFMESFKESDFLKAGIDIRFVQDNHSVSSKNVVRGLHFQKPPAAQAKLVRVVRGVVWDVAVDLRTGSPTFGRWFGIELSETNRRMFYIPAGFGHGFIALVDDTHLLYKCSAEYSPADDGGVRWDDPDIGIKWPVENPLVSEKDALLPRLSAVRAFLPSDWR